MKINFFLKKTCENIWIIGNIVLSLHQQNGKGTTLHGVGGQSRTFFKYFNYMETIFQRFNKEQASDYVNEMAATFGDVCQAANIVKETAKKFDGKCLNVRFLRAVNEQCAKIQGAMAVRVYENSSHTLEFSPRRCRYNISHDFCLCIWDFTTKITNAENRIQYKEVEACVDKLNEQLTNSLSRYVDAVEHWDDYMAKMDEIGRMLVEKIADINGLFVPSDLKLVRGVNWRIETKM